jgi:hypothetical protein
MNRERTPLTVVRPRGPGGRATGRGGRAPGTNFQDVDEATGRRKKKKKRINRPMEGTSTKQCIAISNSPLLTCVTLSQKLQLQLLHKFLVPTAKLDAHTLSVQNVFARSESIYLCHTNSLLVAYRLMPIVHRRYTRSNDINLVMIV